MHSCFNPRRRRLGIQCTELLTAVALAAIAAVILTGNWHEDLARRNGARVYRDLRAYAVACEAYHADYGLYPVRDTYYTSTKFALAPLSTPIAYMPTSDLKDPFAIIDPRLGVPPDYNNGSYRWAYYKTIDRANPTTIGDYWKIDFDVAMLLSIGPDRISSATFNYPLSSYQLAGQTYDPSNGTVSEGNIVRYIGQHELGARR